MIKLTIIHEEKKLLEWLKWVEIDRKEIEVTREYYDNFIKELESLGDLDRSIDTKDCRIYVDKEYISIGYVPTQIIYASFDRKKHTIKYFEFEENNKEKYEGKTVRIYAPLGGRLIDVFNVESVEGKNLDILYGASDITEIETAYCLSDGITVEIVE